MKLEKLKGSGNQVSIKSEIVAQQASKTRKDLKTQKDPLIRFWILLYSTLLYSTTTVSAYSLWIVRVGFSMKAGSPSLFDNVQWIRCSFSRSLCSLPLWAECKELLQSQRGSQISNSQAARLWPWLWNCWLSLESMKLEKLKGSGNQVSIKSEIVAQQASKTRKDLKTQKDPLIRFWILLYSTLLYSTTTVSAYSLWIVRVGFSMKAGSPSLFDNVQWIRCSFIRSLCSLPLWAECKELLQSQRWSQTLEQPWPGFGILDWLLNLEASNETWKWKSNQHQVSNRIAASFKNMKGHEKDPPLLNSTRRLSTTVSTSEDQGAEAVSKGTGSQSLIVQWIRCLFSSRFLCNLQSAMNCCSFGKWLDKDWNWQTLCVNQPGHSPNLHTSAWKFCCFTNLSYII